VNIGSARYVNMQALNLVFNMQGETVQVQHIVDSLLQNAGKLLFHTSLHYMYRLMNCCN
jgi:hypothetical protein